MTDGPWAGNPPRGIIGATARIDRRPAQRDCDVAIGALIVGANGSMLMGLATGTAMMGYAR